MTLDRITPTRRPERSNDGTQRWRELLFVHWEVDEEALRALVPARLSLDAYEGTHYVGLVPFKMRGTRTSWMPRGTGLDFLETNLRCYVHYEGRPGVYFFSLEAASWLAVRVARAVWKLPYHHASMAAMEDGAEVHYTSRRKDGSGANLDVRYRVGDPLGPSLPGSLEHFLLERYLLFSERGEQLLEGQVHHVPYPAHHAEVLALDEGLIAAAGLPAPARAPDLAHYAPGVDVEVFGPWPV
ncbi:MAG: YqjF family protein [Sandaracinaceae bacterium]